MRGNCQNCFVGDQVCFIELFFVVAQPLCDVFISLIPLSLNYEYIGGLLVHLVYTGRRGQRRKRTE